MHMAKSWAFALSVALAGCGTSTIPNASSALRDDGSAATMATAGYSAQAWPPEPVTFFLTQYTHPVYHPQPAPPQNANCGPTSLSMVLTALGKVPQGLKSDTESLIRRVRFEMTGENASGTWTYPAQFPKAAASFGLRAAMVKGGVDAVLAAMAAPGRLVVVNVNPTPAYANQLTMPLNAGHFAVVAGVDGDTITLNDPLADGPIKLTRRQLATALTTPLGKDVAPFNGGVVLWAE
jgi:hypothetical protein